MDLAKQVRKWSVAHFAKTWKSYTSFSDKHDGDYDAE